jgi:fructose-bisphosphate aldolase, class I
MNHSELLQTIADLVKPGTGILAADESTPTCTKRFDSVGVESTEESRRLYREMLLTTPDLDRYVSGVILFEETLGQLDSQGIPFSELLAQRGIVPGIKVDKGVKALPNSPDEKYTQGLDGLADRLQAYKKQGARFAKWRAVYSINDRYPSRMAMAANAEGLAMYAAICQDNGIVPIVEPELLMDGGHDLERSAVATEKTLNAVFAALNRNKVFLEGIILKPSMVITGSECAAPASVIEVAEATVTVLRRAVPAAVPSINFLSGGQSEALATEHLAAMNASIQVKPWMLSFSYGRALQAPALKAWAEDIHSQDAIKKAQAALLAMAKANGEAATPQ